MAMQESGKGAGGSGANPAMTADKADELAASFKPAWDVEEPDPTEISGPPAVVASPVIMAGGTEARAAEPSSEAIEPEQVLEVAPAPKPAPAPAAAPAPAPAPVSTAVKSVPPPAAKTPAAKAMSGAAPVAMKPVAKPVAKAAPAKDPYENTDDIVLPKKGGKGLLFAIIGIGIAASVGVVLKFYAGDEGAKSATPTTQTASPAPTKEDIPPPPPPKDEPAAKAEPQKAEPKAEPQKAEPPPTPTKEPVVAPTPKEPPKTVAVAPPPRAYRPPPAAAAPPPAPKSEPKTPPKPTGGAIVRDNPF